MAKPNSSAKPNGGNESSPTAEGATPETLTGTQGGDGGTDDATEAHWAVNDAAPEVMSTRDLRRAGQDPVTSPSARDGLARRETPRQGGGDLQVVGPATAWLNNGLAEAMRSVEANNANAVEDIINRVMVAETLDDILADDTTIDAEDLVGVSLQVWSFKVNESDFAQGMPGYMVIEAVRRDTNEQIVFTCGATKVQAQLLRMQRLNLLPAVVKLAKPDKATRSGFFPLQLVKG